MAGVYFCRMPVEESDPNVVYDHVKPLWISGSDADDDIAPIHANPCNKLKTAADLKAIAKIRRIIKKDDEPKEASRLQSRGFDKTKTRGFDGRVRARRTSLHPQDGE